MTSRHLCVEPWYRRFDIFYRGFLPRSDAGAVLLRRTVSSRQAGIAHDRLPRTAADRHPVRTASEMSPTPSCFPGQGGTAACWTRSLRRVPLRFNDRSIGRSRRRSWPR